MLKKLSFLCPYNKKGRAKLDGYAYNKANKRPGMAEGSKKSISNCGDMFLV